MVSKERSYGANSLLSAVGWAVPAVAFFFALPITVRGLGPDQYGLLALTGALTGYLGLMEMGLGTAIMRYLSYYRALDQGRPMLGVVWFSLRWFFFAGLLGAAFFWVAAPWLSSSVIKMPQDLQATSIVVIRLMAVNFVLGLLVSVGFAIPQAFLRYDIAAAAGVVLGSVSAVAPAAIVSLGYGLVAISVFSIVLNCVAIVAYAIIGWLLFRPVNRSAGPTWREIRRRVLTFAGLTALNQLGDVIMNQTNRVVVGIADGTAAAGYYQVPYALASRVNMMLARVAQVLFPTASGLLASDDLEAVQVLYLRTSRLFFLINFSVTMGMCVLAWPFLTYWVSSTYASEGAAALAIFAIAQSLHAATMSASFVNLSAARPGINLAFSTAANVLSVAAVYPLTVRFGITGAALAGLVAAANVPFFLHYANARVLHVSSRLVWRKCYQPTVIGAGATSLLAYFLLRPLCHSLLTTVAIWCLIVVVSVVVSGLIGAVSREDLRTARRLAGSFRRRGVPH
jgi:O-antigen/teichoic acid export membrane protein